VIVATLYWPKPSVGSIKGGNKVVLESNTPLGDGQDVQSVTLGGIPATIISQTQTTVTVIAGEFTGEIPEGYVDVVINSTTWGITTKSEGYRYVDECTLCHTSQC